MSSKNEDITKPRLESQEERENHQREKWVRKVLDVKEAKQQIILALPMILTNLFYYLIPIISVMFAGHLGKPQLAGATLANSWATVTGFAFMFSSLNSMYSIGLVIGALALVQGLLVKSTTFGDVTRHVTLDQEVGLSGALETLCGQGYGAKLYKMLGIYLQASCIVSLVFSTIISIIWWFTEPILKLLHQTPEISKEASIYMKYLIPGLFAYGVLQNILRFLQMQSVVLAVVGFSLVPLVLHCGLTYLLVHCTTLGYKGAPLATSITFWVSVIILLIYVNFAKKFEHTWRGLSMESLSHVFTNLKLALPSAAMVCLEYWAFEILVFLAGLMPNPESSTSLIAMCVNTQASAYMFSYGLTAAVSTRVSNELGEGNTKQAKQAMGVALRLTILLVGIVLIFLGFGHDIWAGFFSGNPTIIKSYASMTTLVCISIFFDYFQSTLSGVCRGCGWQHLAVYINLGTFYLIGMPIACVLAFKFHFHAKGLWIGVLCGLIAQSFSLLLVTRLRKWTTIELPLSSTENFVV